MGSIGSIYKGYIKVYEGDDRKNVVAIKGISRVSKQGMRELRAELSDMGIAKLGPPTLSNALIKLNSGVSGTIGYLDLEYALSGQLTEKSDLFSFAIGYLEVLCAKSSSTEIPECVDKGAGQPMMGEMEVELECALELQGSADAIKQLKESGTTTTTSLAPPPPPAHDMEDYTY
ncbi:hypothetical protein ACFX19_034281 [Malus domestica]